MCPKWMQFDQNFACMYSYHACPTSSFHNLIMWINNTKKNKLLTLLYYLIINQLHALICQIYFGRKLYMFRTVPLSIIRSFSPYKQQWYMSYCFADSLRAGSGCSILILLASCQQNSMTYTIAVCTVKNSWWWTEELSEICRVSFQNKFEKLMHLVGLL